jgi:hypothetical protein
MYSLLPCLGLLALLSYQNALQEERGPGWWLAYAVLMAVGVATHYYFALIWVTNTLYLILDSLRRRRLRRWGAAVQGLLLLAAATWLVAAPGLRSSLARIWEGETAFGLAYKLGKVMPTLILAEQGGGAVPLVAHVLAIAGWALVLVGAWWSSQGQVITRRSWQLLMLLLVVPLAASLFIPYGVLGRHLGYTLAALLVFMALGLLALKRSGQVRLAAGILAYLLFTTYGLAAHYSLSNGNFGQAMAYIDERAWLNDMLILSQPAQHPLVTYYNKGGYDVRYLPRGTSPLTPPDVDDALSAITWARSRLWLGPIGAWTADPDLLVEQWLTANAFQAERTWFPDSSSVSLYFTDSQELTATGIYRMVWGGRIRLVTLETSPLEVAPGGAVQLRLHWHATTDLNERYIVQLSLADEEGIIWAERHSEPCGGWCPTNTWKAGPIQQDQHALLIPPGTPPGAYHLELAWLPLDGEPAIQAEEGGQRMQRVAVAQVTISQAEGKTGEPWAIPNPLQATFGGQVSLLGHQLTPVEAQIGEALHLDTHWRAEAAPTDDYVLLAELVNRQGRAVTSWELMPSADSYPTGMWQSGQYLRGRHDLRLPSSIPPGHYRLQIALLSPAGQRLVVAGRAPRQALGGLIRWQHQLQGQNLDLGSVRVVDRPRRFKPAAMTHTLKATVGNQAHLTGYDLNLGQAYPGGQVHLTLHWQAGGPMVQPFKVFSHLIDEEGAVWAQHDAPPGGGCCPANTWAKDEVIVDEHTISLSADLPPGIYHLVVGMYDEETASRLLAYGADGRKLPHDRVQITTVEIGPGPTKTPIGSQPDHVYYIPLVKKGAR